MDVSILDLDVSWCDVYAIDVVHRVVCGDVLDAEVQRRMLLAFPEKVDFLYTDLPWGNAMYQQFYRLAGFGAVYSYEDFLKRVVELSGHLVRPGGSIVFEMGISGLDALMDILSDAGFRVAWVQKSYYGKRKYPSRSWTVAGRFGNPLGMPKPDLEGQFGFEVVRRVMAGFLRRGDSYLDICAGKLLYFECAMKHGARAFGVELIPRKLQSGLKRLLKRNHVLSRLEYVE